MRNTVKNPCAATPLPSRGGVGGGVCIFIPLNQLLTPPLPLPYRGGERLRLPLRQCMGLFQVDSIK